jgi:hypothetical protein
MVTMIIVGTNLGTHNMFDLSLINANMITSEHLMWTIECWTFTKKSSQKNQPGVR